jgi:hypothetical protein
MENLEKTLNEELRNNDCIENLVNAIDSQKSIYDAFVVDGKLVKPVLEVFLSLLSKSDSGTRCASEDVTILVSDDYEGDTTHWELKKYEYKYS